MMFKELKEKKKQLTLQCICKENKGTKNTNFYGAVSYSLIVAFRGGGGGGVKHLNQTQAKNEG
jgi:hypothetical protein